MLKAKAQGLQSIINLAVKCWSHGEPTAQLIYLPLLRATESMLLWDVLRKPGDTAGCMKKHKNWEKKRYCREKHAPVQCYFRYFSCQGYYTCNAKVQWKINLFRHNSGVRLSTDLGACTDWTIKGDVEIPTWLSQRRLSAFFSTVMLLFDLWGLITVLLNEMSRLRPGLHVLPKA